MFMAQCTICVCVFVFTQSSVNFRAISVLACFKYKTYSHHFPYSKHTIFMNNTSEMLLLLLLLLCFWTTAFYISLPCEQKHYTVSVNIVKLSGFAWCELKRYLASCSWNSSLSSSFFVVVLFLYFFLPLIFVRLWYFLAKLCPLFSVGRTFDFSSSPRSV